MARLIRFLRRFPGAAAAIGLLLLPVAMLGPALLPGRVMSPADNLFAVQPWKAVAPEVAPINPLLNDVTYMFHPWLIYAAGEIRQGRFPLWNPHAFTGVPFFANPQTALLFPLNALAYILPIPTALTLISLLKLSAAGLGMYWFLRLLRTGRVAALAGSLAFMFSGVLVVWLQWSFGNAMIVLPLLFGMTERLRERRDPRTVGGLALVVALEIFAGYPQTGSQGFLVAAFWALYRAWGADKPWGFLARFAAGMGLGVVTAAVQLLPFLEYALESSVFSHRIGWMPALSLPLSSAITLLMPYYYGSPHGRNFWGYWNFNEITTSVGLVPWVVLPAALLAAWSRVGTKFFVGLAAVTAAILYGMPGVGPTLASLPPLSFGFTHRLVAFFVFALCVLCAIGFDTLTKPPRASLPSVQTGVKVVFVALLGIAFFFVLNDYAAHLRPTRSVPVFVQYMGFLFLLTLATLLALRLLRDGAGGLRWRLLLVLVQLASLSPLVATYNSVIDLRLFYPEPPPAIRHLQRESARDLGRVALGEAKNIGMLYGLFEVAGYDGMTPHRVEQIASPAETVALLGSGYLKVTADFSSATFDLLGIRRVMLEPDAPSPAPHFTLEYDGPDARIYRSERTLPRAFLVWKARRCVDEASGLRLIWADMVDFSEEVLIAACDAPAVGPRGGGSSVQMVEYGAERVVIRAVTDSAAYLVLTDTWFPGWRARVNGIDQAVWRANHAFRAVWLPPGAHAVEFRYRPLSFQWGLGLSVLAACVAAGLCLGSRRPGHE